MEKIIIKFGDIKIEKQKTYFNKKIDIDKVLLCKKVIFGKKGFKYFMGYTDAKKNRPLCIFI